MGIVVSLDARRQGRRTAGGHRDRVRTAFHFDLADPGTYLAAERVDRLFPGVAWMPTSLAVVHAKLATEPPWSADDAVAARAAGLRMPLVWPERHPAARPAAMRAAAYAAEIGRGAAFVVAASRLAFCGGFDLDDPEVLAEAAAAGGVGLRECMQAAGESARDEEMADEAARLVAAGADRLPIVRVGRLLFPGEERVGAASAAWRESAPVRRRA
jgi:2-hydroxychromene-2-carboxylate isomerase